MLIELTSVPHPDLNGGMPQPVFLDASRVLLIIQGHFSCPKIGAIERKQELSQQLYRATCGLSDHVGGYIPQMSDPIAVEWMVAARAAAAEVGNAYQQWLSGSRTNDFHPMAECTEVQLACGTALEHGVMLSRVWVSESVGEVARRVREATAGVPS